MDLDPTEYMQGIALVQGVYERNEVEAFLRLISPGDTVVDVGANIGQFSLLAAQAVGEAGKIHSFEPLETTFSRLTSHIEAGPFRNSICAWNTGLGDVEETVSLWGSREVDIHGARNDGLTSAYTDDIRTEKVGEMKSCRWDDTVGGRVDVVKIDCEGYELNALRGMAETLRQHTPRLLIEMNPTTFHAAGYESRDIARLLGEFSYSFFRVGNRGTLTPIHEEGFNQPYSWTLVALGPRRCVPARPE
jgi:FkbM family methyltransferase